VRPGTYCAAYNPTLKQWHRCEVLKVKDLEAEIRYIDIGAMTHVLHTDLKILPPQFMHHARFVVNCSLFNVTPSERRGWSDAGFNSFNYFIEQQKTSFRLRHRDQNNVYHIDLIVKDLNVAQELVKEGQYF
jgi:hypothetical protein